MYRVVQKLKGLKIDLKKINKEGFSDVQVVVTQAYRKLLQVQSLVHSQPYDYEHDKEERKATEEYRKAQKTYLSFLRQKAKAQWIDKGDDNTHLFHQCIKARRNSNRVNAIQNGQGQWVNEAKQVQEAFLSFYKDLLGKKLEHRCKIKNEIMGEGYKLTDEQQRSLECSFTVEDVKRALMSIPNDKAPGIDCYNSYFFKQT